jgi:hypothetical protein
VRATRPGSTGRHCPRRQWYPLPLEGTRAVVVSPPFCSRLPLLFWQHAHIRTACTGLIECRGPVAARNPGRRHRQPIADHNAHLCSACFRRRSISHARSKASCCCCSAFKPPSGPLHAQTQRASQVQARTHCDGEPTAMDWPRTLPPNHHISVLGPLSRSKAQAA